MDKEANSPEPAGEAPREPSLARALIKWALIAGLVGLVIGGAEGAIVGRLANKEDDSWVVPVMLERGLELGLLGALLGAAAGYIDWRTKHQEKPEKRGKKK
jgi:hypothetical protein